MPRPQPYQAPSYRLHKQSGQALVTFNGRDEKRTPTSEVDNVRQALRPLPTGRASRKRRGS